MVVFDPEGTHLTLRGPTSLADRLGLCRVCPAGHRCRSVRGACTGRAATREWRSAAQLAEARAQERDAFRSRSAADFHDEAGGG